MRCILSGAVVALSSTLAFGAQNEFPLHDPADAIISYVQDPFVPADPENGSFDGDYYYKVWPGSVLQRCDGEIKIAGLRYAVADLDWGNDTTIGARILGPTIELPSGELIPDLSAPGSILLPEIVAPGLVSSICAPGGFLTAFEVTETFLTPLTLPAQSEDDHLAVTHFAPAPNSTQSGSLTQPPVNSCGVPGDAAIQMMYQAGSSSVDWLATGTNPYDGWNAGGLAGPNPALLGQTFQITLLTESPVLAPYSIVEGSLTKSPDALNSPIGINSAGVVTGASGGFGFEHIDGRLPATGLWVSVPTVNLVGALGGATDPLPDLGLDCAEVAGVAGLATNPANPLFTAGISCLGVQVFDDDGVAISELCGVQPLPALVNAELAIQSFAVDITEQFEPRPTPLVRINLRADDGCGGAPCP